MAVENLESVAMRAVEMTVLGRRDPRLLVATKHTLKNPKKAGRLLAALANATTDGRSVLLLGVRGVDMMGLDEPPDSKWWRKLENGFPGPVPTLEWAELDIGGARIVAVAPEAAEELVVAHHKNQATVPWFDGRAVRTLRATDIALEHHGRPAETTFDLERGWIRCSTITTPDASVDAFSGRIDIIVDAAEALIEDRDCSGALILDPGDSPIALDVQIHPDEARPALRRFTGGIDVATVARARIYVAGAASSQPGRSHSQVAQVILSIRPSNLETALISHILLAADPERPGYWSLAQSPQDLST